MHRIKPPSGLKAPIAAQREHVSYHHNRTLSDPYHWLKDPDYPNVTDKDVLQYLADENAYYTAAMAPVTGLQEKLFGEVKGRIKEDDAAVPWREGGYEYRWAYATGAEYRQWFRRPVGSEDWALLLDEVAEAGDKDFFRLGGLSISHDGTRMAWSCDDNGSERYILRVRDLTSGQTLTDELLETSGDAYWDATNSGFMYTLVSPEWRPFQVKYHRLGTPVSDDLLVYEETDTSFFLGVNLSASREWFILRSGDHVTADIRIVPATAPTTPAQLIVERITGRDAAVDHGQDQFFIRVNDTHQDFRITCAPTATPHEDHWREIKAGGDGHYWRDMHVFKNFVVLEDRIDGLDQLLIMHSDDEHYVTLPEAAYAIFGGHNEEYSAHHYRFGYTSLVTPHSVFDYDVMGRSLILQKETEIPSGYDKQVYHTQRLMLAARDGVQVPVSLVYKKDTPLDGSAAMHLYAYGAYGSGTDPAFSAARLSLLDRGFIYAIAHIRGGDEMGYGWYEAGKLYQRTNTFNDFVDVARGLCAQGYASEGNISISGGSAGGELMGAVANQAPELWRAVVMHVPFVDVLNTMLDESLPLTPIEWPEWGNPIDSADDYDLLASYSPYDQIEAKEYPPMMVTGGLNDPRVTYWEPAKWTAKLRSTRTDDNLLVMKINMGAGHGGKSGRFQRVQEVSEEYAFILMAFGLED
jgi:oligopeptidase B